MLLPSPKTDLPNDIKRPNSSKTVGSMKPLTSRLMKKIDPFHNGIKPLNKIFTTCASVTTVPCMKGPKNALYARARSVQTHGKSS